MKIGIRLRGATVCMMPLTGALVVLAGCASQPASSGKSLQSQTTSPRDKLPAPFVEAAAYVGHGGALRDTVHITGAYFDLTGDSKSDVLTSLDLRHWEPAKKIADASGTAYTAVVAHSAEFDYVYVRVFGMNGQYTLPFHISK
ncbi:MAG TPA: hypothetical protein VFC78_04485 [Tepidisphaeraceae bacterium]|nr:hypothetical protein [Tepidisphaeraceae bacterium]